MDDEPSFQSSSLLDKDGKLKKQKIKTEPTDIWLTGMKNNDDWLKGILFWPNRQSDCTRTKTEMMKDQTDNEVILKAPSAANNKFMPAAGDV